ncbi:MAG: PspA/IM30 family protein [Anaerolineae bacterium]|nr:PspA/IM30 family protein [Anaerolineae bacterium]
MASLLEKIGTLISANLHYMVDEALKSNSIAVFDQYIRQVDNNLDELEDAAATVGGEARMLRRKYDEFAAKTAELDRNIDIFLSEGREELAAAAQTKFNSTKRLADSYKDQADRQQSEYQKLLDARLKLEAKLTTVKQEREELQALLTLAKSKEVSVKAIKSLDDLVGSGDADVARVADSIRARLDKAQAESDMVTTRLDRQMDDVLERETLNRQLEERKRRLGMSAAS